MNDFEERGTGCALETKRLEVKIGIVGCWVCVALYYFDAQQEDQQCSGIEWYIQWDKKLLEPVLDQIKVRTKSF